MIKTALFPVGGFGVRFLPVTKAIPKEMLPIFNKPLIQFAVEEAINAGIEKIIFVTGRGKNAIENHFDYSFELENLIKTKYNSCEIINSFVYEPGNIAYIRQQEPLGLGHAVWCARHYINEPFFVILADDLIFGANQLIEMQQIYHEHKDSNILLLKQVNNELTKLYGIAKAINAGKYYTIEDVIEKPDSAPSNLSIVGRYILQPAIFETLAQIPIGHDNEYQLTDGIKTMIKNSIPCYGIELKGEHFDCGSSKGMLKAIVKQAMMEGLKEELLSLISDS